MNYMYKKQLVMDYIKERIANVGTVEEYQRLRNEAYNKYNVFNREEFEELFSYEDIENN